MSDMFLVCMLLVKRGVRHIGNGPNKPTATIIGEYSASLQGGTMILSLVGQEIQDLTKILQLFGNTSLMSDIMFLVCMLLVKGSQTLVMDPTSLLQQSLVNTVPHCKVVQ